MKDIRITHLFFGLCGGLLVYEAFALNNQTQGDTISEIFWKANRRPLIPFTFGMLCGHLFWQASSE